VEQIPEESNRKRPRNRARKTQEKPRQGRKAVRQDKRMRHDYRRNRDGRRRHQRRTPGHPRTGIQTLARIRVDKISGRPRRATHAREEREIELIIIPLRWQFFDNLFFAKKAKKGILQCIIRE